MKKEKRFTKPEAEVIAFTAEDIILTSAGDPWDIGNEIGEIGGGDVPNPNQGN